MSYKCFFLNFPDFPVFLLVDCDAEVSIMLVELFSGDFRVLEENEKTVSGPDVFRLGISDSEISLRESNENCSSSLDVHRAQNF